MGAKSKRKGKSGELEFAKAVSAVFGVCARRGQQFSGGYDSPDVVVDMPNAHFEVKRTKRQTNIAAAMEQARSDAPEGATPIVGHRVDHGEWLLTIPLDQCEAFIVAAYLALMAKAADGGKREGESC